MASVALAAEGGFAWELAADEKVPNLWYALEVFESSRDALDVARAVEHCG